MVATALYFCQKCHTVIADPRLSDALVKYEGELLLYCPVCSEWLPASLVRQ